jgi:hypothetical protein
LGTVGTVLAQDGVTQLFTFQVITDASYILPPSNWFTAPGPGTPSSGGLGGLCFLPSMQNFCTELGQSAILSVVYLVPRNGSGYFYFPAADVIAGEIILNGSQIDNGNLQGQYHGFFQGNFNQAIPCG